ncbi:MAG: hypothetical protein J5933_01560 [Clostridia bacterium]|nr:hypothetical protein [Clostridia bacterium]
MKKREFKALKLGLELDIEGADMEVLRKYGKVKNGITREVLVPGDITLHALHYVIQRAFGWQNAHLHNFKLPDEVFDRLTQNSFIRWADYCGIYFRFPTDDMEDLYWDDDCDESVTFRTWLRRKYTGPYKYHGFSEHFMAARAEVRDFLSANEFIRVAPSFSEWMNMSEAERKRSRTRPGVKRVADLTLEDAWGLFACEGGLDELLERLRITEVLGRKATDKQLKALVSEADKRFEDNVFLNKLTELDGTALPLSKELFYEYDYGDGWEVKIRLLDEYTVGDPRDIPDINRCAVPPEDVERVFDDNTPVYRNGEIIEGKLRDQIAAVIKNRRPLCVALDGLPVLDDVGGVFGYCDMLSRIHRRGSQDACGEEAENTREWADMQGWTGRQVKPEKLL